MKGFVRQADPKKDLTTFFKGKTYSNVIFFPHVDLKMKGIKSHENLLLLDNSLSFIKQYEKTDDQKLPTIFLWCSGQRHRLSLIWQFLNFHLKKSNNNEVKDVVLRAIDEFFHDWNVLNIKNFARDVLT